jgi:hypothetical protein
MFNLSDNFSTYIIRIALTKAKKQPVEYNNKKNYVSNLGALTIKQRVRHAKFGQTNSIHS